ncbi:hypothetical protein Nepgr_030077 [Nepenthes gracilis]|uniref:Uncharacterized protein n=1 Tax=Nepenthes gracilis TaxID=150966 RepID=A0AAD3TFK1_NEPGR|nr:hypothetical protein Nepgr_030077 [Nepenthes gracilis]
MIPHRLIPFCGSLLGLLVGAADRANVVQLLYLSGLGCSDYCAEAVLGSALLKLLAFVCGVEALAFCCWRRWLKVDNSTAVFVAYGAVTLSFGLACLLSHLSQGMLLIRVVNMLVILGGCLLTGSAATCLSWLFCCVGLVELGSIDACLGVLNVENCDVVEPCCSCCCCNYIATLDSAGLQLNFESVQGFPVGMELGLTQLVYWMYCCSRWYGRWLYWMVKRVSMEVLDLSHGLQPVCFALFAAAGQG